VSLRIALDEVEALVGALRRAGTWSDASKAAQVVDLRRMHHRVDELVDAFPSDTLHAVAIKAMPLVAVLERLVAQGVGLEAASWEEVALARAAGCPGERIVFDGPAKTDAELRQALDLGCWLNADHPRELERLAEAGAPGDARVGIRVNPGIGAGSIGFTSTVARGSKFGVPIEDAPALVERFPFVSGLHVHTGSQGCGLDLLSAAAHRTAEVVDALDLDWLDVGGGLPVRYTDADPEPPTVADWAESLSQLPGWGRRKLLTEVGRHIHAGGGITLSRIEAVKDLDGTPLLIVHVGADLLLRRVYRPDDWDHEFVVLDPSGRPRSGPLQPTKIGGPLCFSGDLLTRGRDMPQAHEGDLLLIRDTGAYTLSMWSRHCSRGLPPVYGVQDDRVSTLYRGESAADVVRFWSV
jgi:diaminopimelate decarboxylase